MVSRLETEKKYYCIDPMELIKLADSLGFKKKKEIHEIDEYFTDLEGEFIKNRTCLRIRKTNDDSMELTFKGKSDVLSGQYCKLEQNLSINCEDYDDYVEILSSLGYHSYVKVDKDRLVYTLKKNDYTYNIMLDKISEIGGFVEFEIITTNKIDQNTLLKKLNNFVNNFKSLNLKEANEPYRDIVSNYIYSKLTNNIEYKGICIDIDNELMKYEKDFFKQNKDKLSKVVNTNLKWGTYKSNKLLDKNYGEIVDEYLNRLMLDKKNLLITKNLLNQLECKKYIITKVNKTFCEHFLNKININYNNIIFSNGSIKKSLEDKNIDIKSTVIINDNNIEDINRDLLIVINNDKSIFGIKKLDAILLDLDGTLIDSEKAFCNSFKNVLSNKYNIKIKDKDYIKYELENNNMLLNNLRNKYDNLFYVSNDEIMKEIYKEYLKKFKKIIINEETIENFKILKKLKKTGLKLALVTTSKKEYLNILNDMFEINSIFDVIISREDVKNLKPDSEAYLKVLKTLDLDKNNCLCIEDSKRGIDASLNAGLTTIKVNNFSIIKEKDDRVVEYDSTKKILNKVLEKKKIM